MQYTHMEYPHIQYLKHMHTVYTHGVPSLKTHTVLHKTHACSIHTCSTVYTHGVPSHTALKTHACSIHTWSTLTSSTGNTCMRYTHMEYLHTCIQYTLEYLTALKTCIQYYTSWSKLTYSYFYCMYLKHMQ